MKECDYHGKLFSDYLDNVLEEEIKHSLQNHLKNCPACKAKVDDLLHMKQVLAALPRVKTSASFDTVLYSRLRQEIRAQQTRRWSFPFFELNWKIPAYAVATVVLIFFGAFLQRMSYSTLENGSDTNQIAVQKVLQGEMNHVDPGYMIFVGMDTVKNTYKVMNYTKLDYAETMQEFKNTLLTSPEPISEDKLPNLKEAPQNDGLLTLRKKQIEQQKIKNAEFIF
ncbi:hypothetical protein EH223_15745 [candidate division KSB1 bacterium]|nr:zf-HC2 domain-containing protein [candidate division KSB1 bacterium]RQW01151.1 MAG: hypothetical protein EH223_15745 [candidate division KSB1 bacterium]